MSVHTPDIQSGRSADDFARANDLFAIIRALAANETNPAAFVGESFRAIAKEFAAPFALIRARVGPRAIDDYWHTGSTDPGFWRAAVETAIDNAMATATPTARLYRARDGASSIVLIASPMPDESGDVSGAMGLVVPCDDPKRGHELLAQVRAITAMLPPLASSMAQQTARDAHAATSGGSAIQALAIGAGARSRSTLAIAITNQLRARIGCEQVAIAIIKGQRPRLLALSGFADVSERSPGVAVVIASMCEALDLGRTIAWSPTDHDNDYALHRRWSSEADGAAVATIPLKRGDEITALLALRHSPGHRFTDDDLKKIAELASPYAASIELVHRATRSVREHARDMASTAFQEAFRPRGLARTCVAFLACALFLWFCFGSMQDRATVKCRINSSTSVHLAAPFDGALREAGVMAGDSVTAGQVMARFDTTSLDLERARLNSAVQKATIEADVARAKGKESEAMLIEARADVERASMKTIDRKIDAATIRAPADGVILSGDARKLVGSNVSSGQPLFEFAADSNLKIELAIPDRDINRVHDGATGEFIAVARPDIHMPFKITRLRPSAEVRDGQNVFIAEAQINNPEPWMRAGIDGFARIDAGSTAPWRAYLRRAIDYVRLKLWL